MIRNCKILILLFIVAISTLGCSLLSSKFGDAEITFAKTDVGTPTGPATMKSIGPAGGSISSPDGRITVNVPPNDVPGDVQFSIQPITNQAQGGLGNAYRLEPNGQKFTTPVEISLKYDDHDLEGTVPEFLAVTYQNKDGSWQSLKTTNIDEEGKTFTVSTTHFTDFEFLAKIRISPASATIRVGESIKLELIGCVPEKGFWDRHAFSAWCNLDGVESRIKPDWLADIGMFQNIVNEPNHTVVFVAPSKKPSPSVATIGIAYHVRDFVDKGDLLPSTIHKSGIFTAHITIVDRGYKVSGTSHDETYTGVVCDLEKPFTVKGAGLADFAFNFTPSSPMSGTVAYNAGYTPGGASAYEAGKGSYTVTGTDTEQPRITLNLTSGGSITARGRTFNIPSAASSVFMDLTPIEGNECGVGR